MRCRVNATELRIRWMAPRVSVTQREFTAAMSRQLRARAASVVTAQPLTGLQQRSLCSQPSTTPIAAHTSTNSH
jgi:hypothetical protein